MVHPTNCEQEIRETIIQLIKKHAAPKFHHAQHEKNGDDVIQGTPKGKKGKADG